MTKLFTTAGDRLLGLFLGRKDAGACIPEHGQVCKTVQYHYDCYGNCK